MRDLHAPAAAGLAAVLLSAVALMGCGAAHPAAQPVTAKAARTKAAIPVSATSPAAPGAGQATDQLTAIAGR